MKKIFILNLLLLISFVTFSQNTYKATVIDNANTAIPYASIYNKNLKQGSITNLNGNFSIRYINDKDSIYISFLGYKTKIITIKQLKSISKIVLTKEVFNIPSVTVVGHNEKDYLINQIIDVFKLNKARNYNIVAKSNLIAESYFGNIPLERVECIGNLNCNLNKDVNFDIVMGRFGQNNNFNFYSLIINSLLNNVSPFNKYTNSEFPEKISVLNKSRIKRIFNIKIKADDPKNRTLSFTKKEKYLDKNFFDGEITFNKKTKKIINLRFFAEQLGSLGYQSVTNNHLFDFNKLNLNFQFSDVNYELSHISVKYELSYKVKNKIFHINTNIVTFPTDLYSKFFKPYTNINISFPNKYEEILFLSYNNKEWNNNFFNINENKTFSYQYFKKKGYTKDYDIYRTDSIYNFLKMNKYLWRKQRIQFEDLLASNHTLNKKTIETEFDKYIPEDFYKLSVSYFLKKADSLFLIRTFIDLDNSYYLLKKDALTLTAINIYFDIFEKNRKALDSLLQTIKNDKKAIDIVNNYYQKSLTEANKFFYQSKKGQDIEILLKWNSKIETDLGIDNLSLIEKNFASKKANKAQAFFDYYNIGTAYLQIKEYKQAIYYFSKGLKNYGDINDINNTLINRAYAYIGLHQKELACKDLKEAKKNGDKKAKSLIKQYCK